MEKRSKKKMLLIVGVLLGIIGTITVFFNIPYSKTKTEFSGLTGSLLTKIPNESGVFTEEDIVGLPFTTSLPAVSLHLMKTVKCFPLQPMTGRLQQLMVPVNRLSGQQFAVGM